MKSSEKTLIYLQTCNIMGVITMAHLIVADKLRTHLVYHRVSVLYNIFISAYSSHLSYYVSQE